MDFWKQVSNIKPRKPWINSLLGERWCPSKCFIWIPLFIARTLIYGRQHKYSRMELAKFLVLSLGCKFVSCCTIWIKVKFITKSFSWWLVVFFLHSLLPSFHHWFHQNKFIFLFLFHNGGQAWLWSRARWSLVTLYFSKFKQSLPAQINVHTADAFPHRKLGVSLGQLMLWF